jgi:hypothetical protein
MFCGWNGRENDSFLTDTQKRWSALESFLIKVERPRGTLRVLSRAFKFEWSDHFDPTMTYDLYSGLKAGDGSSGVFLRDLAGNTNRTLVAPDDVTEGHADVGREGGQVAEDFPDPAGALYRVVHRLGLGCGAPHRSHHRP